MSIDVDAYYRRYGPMVVRRCRRMLRDEASALDAAQDVFVQLLLHEDRLMDTAPSSLLYRMATNVCLNRIRSAGRHPEHGGELLQRIACSAEQETRTIAGMMLDRIFAREKVSTRTIATLHLLDGMTLEEVAQEVGMSVSGVRKRLRTLRGNVAELAEV